ncbi:protein-disulfide reductase DsbD family protein [Pseudobacteriovorax antillogorgiicola]|uniref:Thiol:disulfide interchange protein DsbD n=1 Tax=Pseudobacteriovorax antillogorgiicola TaxID=1513793 RepID=A0A1Y6C7J9_9BACT|nr:thioredoxin family protein [Pseudobacteriovorax antillogorgiicola]TCS49453.1 thiol:disulfide interchange protein DsbD [Pseudobacteriovorax antillogorgiicola]SMF46410.1 thiol:disulfide interchange protein DsbD [Pseudobacteriovorax antillogorgiicola]
MKYLVLLLTIISSVSHASESAWRQQDHSQARLIMDKSALVPGGSLRLGVWIKLEDHWHTYWENPGDSASSAVFAFKTPDGYKSSPIQFPLPQRIPVGPLMSFGYEGEVLLSSTIQIPSSESAHLGERRSLALDAEWLVCKEECIPAFELFEFELPIAETASATEHMSLFTEYDSTIASQTHTAELEHQEKTMRLEISGLPTEVQILDSLPFPGSGVNHQMPMITQNGAGSWIITHQSSDVSNTEQLPQFLLISKLADTDQTNGIVLQTKLKSGPAIGQMLLFAFLGGLILNLMPCVFPILTLKLFSFAKAASQDRGALIRSQLIYLAGILSCFWIMSLGIMALKAAGSVVGWGFQLQSPAFVSVLIILFFFLGLNFAGYFEIAGRWTGAGQGLTEKKGWLGSYFTGVLAVVVASPCTAPFMGVALGYALGQHWLVNLSVFTALGLGLGAPYIIAALLPKVSLLLPRPGLWMVRLKEFMAFPLWGTCLWLLTVLGQQLSMMAIIGVLFSLMILVFAMWLYRSLTSPVSWVLSSVASIGGLAVLVYTLQSTPNPEDALAVDDLWTPYQAETLESQLDEGSAVFINFTAAWCITCQVNEKTTFQTEKIKSYVNQHEIKMLKADWTNRDPHIAEFLARYDRAGVPLYLFYPSGSRTAQVLPEVLSPKIFIDSISL